MATDQEIRDSGLLYVPKQKYLRDPFNLSTPPPPPPPDGGIVNTNAFNNSGNDFNPAGNAFGYGEAVQRPGNTYADIVARSGPDSQQARQALVKAGGTAPAGMYQTDYFPGTENELVDAMGRKVGEKDYAPNMNYSETAYDSLETEEDKKGFLSKMMNSFKQKTSNLPSWAKSAMTAAKMLNPLTAIPSLIGQFGGGDGGPNYGIAGLSDQQKAMYDSLSGAGLLYDGPGGMKTYDGKNFSRIDQNTVDNYFSSKIGITRGDTKIDTLEDYEAYIADKPNLLKTYKQYQLLDGTLDSFDKNEKIRAEKIQKIKNAEISRKIRSGDPKNNPSSPVTVYSGSTKSPDYTPKGPNQPDPTPSNNDNGSNQQSSGTNNSQHGSSGMTKSQHSAFRMAKGGRAGYFFGGRVNYKIGGVVHPDGRKGFFQGALADTKEGKSMSPGTDASGGFRGGDNDGGASDNPPVTVVNNNPIDISTVTKSVGEYDIPYGVEALMADKGKLQAVLNADNILDKNLGAEFTYDNGPFSIGAYADMDGDKSLNANYTRNNSNYSFDLNDGGGQLKFTRTFANGGLAGLL